MTQPTTDPTGGQPRSFHLGDILSVTTGYLVTPDLDMGGIDRILGFMTGEELWTHQLPRARAECAPALLTQHPDLADIHPGDDLGAQPTEDTVRAWLAEQVARYGEHRQVRPLADVDHTRIDPGAELRMLRPDSVVLQPHVLSEQDDEQGDPQ